VMATPIPRVSKDSTAKLCCLTKIITNIAVKARNPGTSLKLCSMPISSPVKFAFSTTKLLSNTCHVANAIVFPMANRNNKVLRLRSGGSFINDCIWDQSL